MRNDDFLTVFRNTFCNSSHFYEENYYLITLKKLKWKKQRPFLEAFSYDNFKDFSEKTGQQLKLFPLHIPEYHIAACDWLR